MARNLMGVFVSLVTISELIIIGQAISAPIYPYLAMGLQLDNSLSFRHLFKYASRGSFPFPEPVFFLVPEQLPVIHLQCVSRSEPFRDGRFLKRHSAHFRKGVL